MIDPDIKRAIGQLTYGVNVVSCRNDELVRGFTSTWTYQLSFEEPIIGVSISPKHDTYPLIADQGWFCVSLLAGDQVEPAQYFSYPGHRFKYVGEYFEEVQSEKVPNLPVISDCVAWLLVEVEQSIDIRDHTLFIGEVVEVGHGRLKEPALTYSSRKSWRISDTAAREKGTSVRDKLLAMVEEKYPAGSQDADDD